MAQAKSETGYLRASLERTKEEEVAYDESLVEPIINRGVEFWAVHYIYGHRDCRYVLYQSSLSDQ